MTQEGKPGRRSKINHQRRRRSRLRIGVPICIVGALLGTWLAVLGANVLSVRSELMEVQRLAMTLRAKVLDGDLQGASETSADLESSASFLRRTTEGPAWTLASVTPLVGANFHAVREVTVSLDEITTKAVDPLVAELSKFDWKTLSPSDGRINTDDISQAAPTVVTASRVVRQSAERLQNLDLDPLLPQISDPIQSATSELIDIQPAIDGLASAAQLIPGLLGADEERSILVLIQNNAETRATGGLPGALAVLTAKSGQISLGQQTSASGIGPFDPAVPVDEQQVSIFTERLGRLMHNVNLTPDFPTAAGTAKEMWEIRHPEQNIDAVLAIDPVVLAHLLSATGAVELDDPELLALVSETALPSILTSENVVKTVLSDVYQEIEDTEIQDVYFASVASQVFEAFASGQGDLLDLVSALRLSVEEQRVYLWSADTHQQSLITATPLAGSVIGASGGGASFGMYFNDGTGSKMDYHARREVQLVQGCRANGYGQFTLRTFVTNDAPADAETSLPAYVTGDGVFGVRPGSIRTNYVAYGPVQSLLQSAAINGETVPVSSDLHGQRPVGTATVELAPGESAVVDFVFVNVVQDSVPQLSVTPTIAPRSEVVLPLSKDTNCQ